MSNQPRAILIGPPGSGKSSVGRELAQILGCSFSDSDAEIVDRAGKPIAEIFLDDGEPAFREIERVVVGDLLNSESGVLSLGGGAILNEETQAKIWSAKVSGAKVIYLHITLTTAVPRVGLNKDRPMLILNPRQQWSALLEARRPIYEELATHSYSTDDAEARNVANLIAQDMDGRDA